MAESKEDTLRLIIADCESDAGKLDGKVVTGLVIGTNLGNLYAMIQALAKMMLDG